MTLLPGAFCVDKIRSFCLAGMMVGMKKLLYVRHGQTYLNEAKLISGQTETALTEKGKLQAKKSGALLKELPELVDLIICSPLTRAQDTATIIANELGYPAEKIEVNELFIERTFGKLEGTSRHDFLATHTYKDFDNVEGAETIEHLKERAKTALAYLKTCNEDTILVVGHGAFGRAIRRVVDDLPHSHEYHAHLPIGNADIIKLI